MNGELMSVQTVDGLTLHGVLYRSERTPNPNTDLLIFVHGVGSNFYQTSLVRKTLSRFLEDGIAVLSVNTRGHDFVFAAGPGSSQTWQGSANEIVDECRLDIEAWARKAKKAGFERIGLFGHSLGAIKTIYSEAIEPNSEIERLIAVSPSCLSCSFFQKSSRQEEFQKCLDWAKSNIAQGRTSVIEEVTFPFRLMMSPRTFLDKYGEEEKYNILRFVGEVEKPLKLIFGELEVAGGNPAFENLDERALAVVADSSNISMQVIADADHYYSGVQIELADSIVSWINERDSS